ncbi:hypothetical protein FXO37_33971 [Capsicum annuum]|nr:hypothetical protein FXO37_33971 [Capsicum annuum]
MNFNILKFLVVLYGNIFLTFSQTGQVNSTPLALFCPNTTSYGPNSTYNSNLNALVSSLSSNTFTRNGFYNFTAGHTGSDKAYGLCLFMGDVSPDVCQNYVSTTSKEILENCHSGSQDISHGGFPAVFSHGGYHYSNPGGYLDWRLGNRVKGGFHIARGISNL